MRKVCKTCNRVFLGKNKEVRCFKCQKTYRTQYKSKMSDVCYPKSATRDKETWQWYKVIKDLSITECKFLLGKYSKDIKCLKDKERNDAIKRQGILKEVLSSRLLEREFVDEFLQES